MQILFSLLRIRQWVKNAFIVFPLVFSGNFFYPGLLGQCLLTGFAFCFIASAVYVFNDVIDVHRDKFHPQKALRPFAAGKISKEFAVSVGVILLFIGLGILNILNPTLFYIGILYLLIHALYGFILKKFILIDVFMIALGFLVRILAGAIAVNVQPSLWLLMSVFVLALFLGFAKRRHEVLLLDKDAASHREVLAEYTPQLLDQLLMICSTLAIVFYALYTISVEVFQRFGNYYLAYSIIFVIYGIFRYFYLVHVSKKGGDPGDILLSDTPLFINLIIWGVYIFLLIYGNI